MKRNQATKKVAHQRNVPAAVASGRKRSKYGQKVARGNQMYGPGCCAHTTVPRRQRDPGPVDLTDWGLAPAAPRVREG